MALLESVFVAMVLHVGGSEAAGVSRNSQRAQTCTSEGSGLQNTTKIPRKGHPEREKKNENESGRGKKSRLRTTQQLLS